MDLRRVAIFARVVQDGGFTAAAKALGLPKSSVSRSVALLEREVGTRLLRRSTRGISLTDAGSVFHAKVALGLSALDEAREDLVALDKELRGRIRITAPPDIAAWMLSPILAKFLEQHPAVVVNAELTVRNVDVVDERFDLALRARGVDDLSLVAKKLPPIESALYASPAYLARHGQPRRPSDLARHRCILFGAQAERATWTLRGPRATEKVEVSGSVNTNDYVFALEMAASSSGIALLPRFVAEPAGRGRIVRVLDKYISPGFELHLVHAAGRYLPRRVAALRDLLVAELAR
jgi:DNA-binding transcriptional LysR family regulator